MAVLVLQHAESEHLGTFDIECEYVRLFSGALVPQNLSEYNALVILGGPMNVYEEDKYPYLKSEDLLIKEALKNGLPTLGICLGSQLIAKAGGAKVYGGQEKEIGWYNAGLTEEGRKDKIFSMFEDSFTVFQWHGDTFDLPEGAVLLAKNDLYNQAFRLGNAYALQFHIEVTERMISEWIEDYREELQSLKGTIDPEKIIEDTEKNISALNQCAEEFISRWIREVES